MIERREHVLDLVTEGYIRSARPVPSAWIAGRLEVSSATVRNDFSALERDGYLTQPHTSAGRVPTALGYTRYARKFIPPRRLPALQRRLLAERLGGAHGDVLLQRVADVSAELSGYAVVVTLPADDALVTLEIHLSALSEARMLAVVVLEHGLVRQVVVDLMPTPGELALREAESSLRGLTLPVGEVPTALADIATRAEEEVARTFRALARAWPAVNPPRVFSRGLRNLLAEPESADPDFVRRVVERVEGPLMEATPEDAPRVSLGETDEMPGVTFESALALVSSSLVLGSSRGGLLLLGPVRMRYPEVLMVARGVTEAVSRRDEEQGAGGVN